MTHCCFFVENHRSNILSQEKGFRLFFSFLYTPFQKEGKLNLLHLLIKLTDIIINSISRLGFISQNIAFSKDYSVKSKVFMRNFREDKNIIFFKFKQYPSPKQ